MFISSGKLHPLWYSFQENDPHHIQNSTDKLPRTECVIYTMNGVQLLQSRFGINRARQKHISKHCSFKILSSLKSLKCERQINIICICHFFFGPLVSYEVCIYIYGSLRPNPGCDWQKGHCSILQSHHLSKSSVHVSPSCACHALRPLALCMLSIPCPHFN